MVDADRRAQDRNVFVDVPSEQKEQLTVFGIASTVGGRVVSTLRLLLALMQADRAS